MPFHLDIPPENKLYFDALVARLCEARAILRRTAQCADGSQ